MAIRGENVGTAYVKILADGSGMDSEIRRAFKENEKEFDDAGRRNSDRYAKAFEQQMRSAPNEVRLQKSLTNALAKGDFLEREFFRGKNWLNFRDQLQKQFGEAGHLAGQNLEQELVQGLDFKGLGRRLENIMPEITKAHKQNVAAIKAEYSDLTSLVQRMNAGEEETKHNRKELIAQVDNLRTRMERYGLVNHKVNDDLGDTRRLLRTMHPDLSRFSHNIDTVGDSVGRAFGKGSRNNFVNFIGSMAGNMIRVGKIVPSLAGAFKDLGFKMSTAFAEGGSNIAGTFKALGAAAGSIGPALLAGAAGLAAFSLLIGPLIALVSLLAGTIVALTGTIAFGLVGAIAPLVGALLPLAAGIGVAVGAFISLDDAMKKRVMTTIKPLTSAFGDLFRAAAKPIFSGLKKDVDLLVPAVQKLKPLFTGIGTAIGNVGSYWAKAISGPGFAAFRREMTDFLPGAVESLGKSFGNLVGGLGGVFRALIPITQEFLGWLQRITGDFAKFTNSADGQDKLKAFFRDTADSAKTLGRFIGAASGLLAELLDKGRGTGDTIFDSMTNAIRDFTDYLRKNPDILKNWFADAKDAADSIGDALVNIGKAFDALDSTLSRNEIKTTLDLIAAALDGVAYSIYFTQTALSALGGLLGRIGSDVATTFRQIGSDISTTIGGIPGFFRALPARIGAAISALPGILRHALSGAGSGAAAAVNGIVGFFQRLPARIASAISATPGRVRAILSALPGIALGMVSRSVAPFLGFPRRVGSAISSIVGVVRGVLSRLAPLASSAVGASVRFFATLPGRAASAISGLVGRFRGVVGQLAPAAARAVGAIVGAFSSLPGRIANAISGLGRIAASAFRGMVTAAAAIPGQIAAQFRGLAGRIIAAVGTIHLPTPTINMPNIPKIHIPGTAVGGLFNYAQTRLIGEAGPEAVVPLNRPLGQVDPAVRWLSAIAQGKVPAMANGGVEGGGRRVDASGWTIVSNASDPRVVATEVINRLATTGY